MQRSEIFQKVMKALPTGAQENASEILRHLQAHDNLIALGEDKKSHNAVKTKKGLWQSIGKFKNNHPDLIHYIYKGLSKSSKKVKQSKKREQNFIQNMMDIRMLTSSFIMADAFYDNCLQSESIHYIKNEMLRGYVPASYGELTSDYRDEIVKLAKSIIYEFESNENFHLRIIASYKKTMGLDDETSGEKARRLKEIALLLREDDLSITKMP
jgi:hypothetical protein